LQFPIPHLEESPIESQVPDIRIARTDDRKKDPDQFKHMFTGAGRKTVAGRKYGHAHRSRVFEEVVHVFGAPEHFFIVALPCALHHSQNQWNNCEDKLRNQLRWTLSINGFVNIRNIESKSSL